MYYIYAMTPNLTSIHCYLLVPERGFYSVKTAREFLYSSGFNRLEIRKNGLAFFKWHGTPPDWFEVPRNWEGVH